MSEPGGESEQQSARIAVPRGPSVVHVEQVMGTAVTFDVRLESDEPTARDEATEAIRVCSEWLHWVDQTFTTYDAGSFVSRLGRGEIAVDDCPPEVALIVEECDWFREVTRGWFDPWASPIGGFDPSGLVKGWATQGVSDRLRRAGFERHCVNAGGDVVVAGESDDARGWGIGIAHPLVPGTLCATLLAMDEGIATSGTAERGYHVWRPVDGSAATDLASVTIVHDDLTVADVYATAAFAMGGDARQWLEEAGIDGYAVTATGEEWETGEFGRRRHQ
ncbi:MAG TPA: FAD:protein FMN transferase [Acidimicrobiales bacterium]|nr:FAD:protein FMN transferase [Acidimicrobiales bacterium]